MNIECLYPYIPAIFQILDFISTLIGINYFELKEVVWASKQILDRFGMKGLLIFKLIVGGSFAILWFMSFRSPLFVIYYVIGGSLIGLLPTLDNLKEIMHSRDTTISFQ